MYSDRVYAVLNWLQPVGLKALLRFLGFANYYCQFIQQLSQLVLPLTAQTQKGLQPSQVLLGFSSGPLVKFLSFRLIILP